jgi:hypothetical protein
VRFNLAKALSTRPLTIFWFYEALEMYDVILGHGGHMYLQLACVRCWPHAVLLGLVVIVIGAASPGVTVFRTRSPQDVKGSAAPLRFIREFSTADDVRQGHPILDRSLDIVAGPGDPHVANDKLVGPHSVATDSTQRIFVADPNAGVVHVFDFGQSQYSTLKGRGTGRPSPTASPSTVRTMFM